MKSNLRSFEVSVCIVLWTCANVFTLVKLYQSQTEILENNPEAMRQLSDLEPGWGFLSRLKDVSDVEWTSWKYFIRVSWCYLIVQAIITEIIRRKEICQLKYWYIISSLIFVVIHLGYKQLLLIMVQPLLYASVIFLGGRKMDIWVTSSLLLMSYNSIKYRTFFWYFLDHDNLYDEEVYLILFCIPWVELRCISFCLDYVDKSKDCSKETSKIETLIDLISYVLYVPLLYTGPVILYEDFKKSFSFPNQELSVKLKQFILDMFIFLIYTFVMDVSLHYYYFYAMHSDMELVRMLPTLALCGGGLWMGLQFHMKYVVAYGTTAAFARLDNMEMPPTPRCIARIHVYSQMWRYFDVGLYRFLVKYIYKPSFEALSEWFTLPQIIIKLIASFATFVFIFMWHGTIMRVFVWSVLNYLGITLEYFSKVISTTEQYKWFKKNILRTEAMETRFTAMLCVPLLHLSAVSNFYLFAGRRVGNYYFQYFLPLVLNFNSVIIFVSLYCCCVVSMALQDVPSRTDRKLHVKVNKSMKCE